MEAVALLREAADPDKIILFGSYATDRADPDSDVDFLVVERGDPDVMAEMVHLSGILGDRMIPADVIVVSRKYYDHWRETPGNLMFETATDGRVLYERAA